MIQKNGQNRLSTKNQYIPEHCLRKRENQNGTTIKQMRKKVWFHEQLQQTAADYTHTETTS